MASEKRIKRTPNCNLPFPYARHQGRYQGRLELRIPQDAGRGGRSWGDADQADPVGGSQIRAIAGVGGRLSRLKEDPGSSAFPGIRGQGGGKGSPGVGGRGGAYP